MKLKNAKKSQDEAILSPSEDEIVVIVHKWKDRGKQVLAGIDNKSGKKQKTPKNVSYKEKLRIWKRLCLLHMDNRQKDYELNIQEGKNEEEMNLLSEI